VEEELGEEQQVLRRHLGRVRDRVRVRVRVRMRVRVSRCSAATAKSSFSKGGRGASK